MLIIGGDKVARVAVGLVEERISPPLVAGRVVRLHEPRDGLDVSDGARMLLAELVLKRLDQLPEAELDVTNSGVMTLSRAGAGPCFSH